MFSSYLKHLENITLVPRPDNSERHDLVVTGIRGMNASIHIAKGEVAMEMSRCQSGLDFGRNRFQCAGSIHTAVLHEKARGKHSQSLHLREVALERAPPEFPLTERRIAQLWRPL